MARDGHCERANPSRTGEPRWRYTYGGVVYITDATRKHEVTSWRIDGEETRGPPKFGALAGFSCHVVLIVDHSGSMRRQDVPGYDSRTEAVYSTLRREFLQPQLDQMESAQGVLLGDAAVNLIEMSDNSTVRLDRVAMDDALGQELDL